MALAEGPVSHFFRGQVTFRFPDTVRLDESVSGSQPDGSVYRFVNDRLVFEDVSFPMICSVWVPDIVTRSPTTATFRSSGLNLATSSSTSHFDSVVSNFTTSQSRVSVQLPIIGQFFLWSSGRAQLGTEGLSGALALSMSAFICDTHFSNSFMSWSTLSQNPWFFSIIWLRIWSNSSQVEEKNGSFASLLKGTRPLCCGANRLCQGCCNQEGVWSARSPPM